MDLFSVDFNLNELIFMRQASDVVNITGKDAKFLANLQNKLEHEITEINSMMGEKKNRGARKSNRPRQGKATSQEII
jgi:acid phosphatase family membrane protein YuiD